MEEVTSQDDKKQHEEEGEHFRAEDHTVNYGNEMPSKEIFPNPQNTLMALADTGTTGKQKGMKTETIQNDMEEAYKIFKNVSEKPSEDEYYLHAELLTNNLKDLSGNTHKIIVYESNLMSCAKMQKQNKVTHVVLILRLLPLKFITTIHLPASINIHIFLCLLLPHNHLTKTLRKHFSNAVLVFTTSTWKQFHFITYYHWRSSIDNV
jgi:hypothetical protein